MFAYNFIRRASRMHLLAILFLCGILLPAPAHANAEATGLPLTETRYRITLKQSGVYRLTYAELLNAGASLATIDPRNFRLYRGDEEVAFDLVGGEDGRFDPGDQLRFYAPPLQNLLTDTTTFWLALGTDPGRSMGARSIPPGPLMPAGSFVETTRFEQNKSYRSNMPMLSDVDHWYWGQTSAINGSGILTLTVSFDLDQPLGAGSAKLVAELWGASSDGRVNPDHRLRLSINNTVVGTVEWDGAVATLSEITFPQALLKPGQNRLTLYMPADTGARDAQNRLWEADWLNWFELSYARASSPTAGRLVLTPPEGLGDFESAGWPSPAVLLYDVSNPLAPVRLTDFAMTSTGATYSLRFSDVAPPKARYAAALESALLVPLAVTADAPSGLRSATRGADYLFITHGAFLAGIQPLIALREGQGYVVRVVDVQDIYDEFSGGALSYHAIHDFLAYAYHFWPEPAPRYVLLVGDGTYDFMNREGYGAKTFIPPFLAAVDPLLGETAADNRFVTVDGDDILADLRLGRLPVNNTAELNAMVNKIIAYETAPLPGDWRTRSVFVSDNPDPGGNFHELSENAVAHLPENWTKPRIYLGVPEYPQAQAAVAQQAVTNAFNAGALLYNYVGHSSITAWASELLLSTGGVAQLRNGGMTPIVLPMTCLEGSYQSPRFAGLSETVVRLANAGAVASWGPTGLGVATGHDFLHQGFMDALFKRDVYILGDATEAGKQNLYENARFSDGAPRFRDLIDTYVLLGDPATRIGVARDVDLEISAALAPGTYEPGAAVTYTLNYRNNGGGRARDVVLSAQLSDRLIGLRWSASGPKLTEVEGAPFTWTLSQLGAGESGQIIIDGQIDLATPLEAYPLAAQFSATSSGEEVDPADNTAGPLYINYGQADIALEQDVLPLTPVQPGEAITITLSYTNLGPGASTGLRIDVPLSFPLEQVMVGQSGPNSVQIPGSQYAFAVDVIPVGERGMITLSGRIPFGVISQQVQLKIAAKARASLPDPDMTNNTSGPHIVVIYGADEYEPDDAAFQARRITLPTEQQRRLYEPMGDEDWVIFSAEAGVSYILRTEVSNSQHGMALYLRDLGGAFLDSSDGLDNNGVTELRWTAPQTGDYYLVVSGGVLNSGVRYVLSVRDERRRGFLPLIQR